MSEGLYLYIAVFCKEFYPLHADLPGEHGACQAHITAVFKPSKVVNAHLGAGMKGQIGELLFYQSCKAEVLHQNGINAYPVKLRRKIQGRRKLPVEQQGIQCYIAAYSPFVAVVHRTGQLIAAEIIRKAPCIEASAAEINGIRSVLHGGNKAVHTACRGKEFHNLSNSYYLLWAEKSPIAYLIKPQRGQ